MASVTGYTAERMQEIEDQAIVDGSVVGGNLILERNNGDTINAGSVEGPPGPTGPSGAIGGSTGGNDNRILRADGTGGTTVQSSGAEVDDSGRIIASLMTVTTAPSVNTDVANKLYVDKAGKGLRAAPVVHNGVQSLTPSTWVSLTDMSITITPELSRWYAFKAQAHFSGVVSAGCTICVFKSTDLVNAICRGDCHLSAGAYSNTATIDHPIFIPSGWDVSTTFIVRAYVNGAVDSVGDSYFRIEDIGVAP